MEVMELVASSNENWVDAVHNAVDEASISTNKIFELHVINFTANVVNGHIAEYKANVNITHV